MQITSSHTRHLLGLMLFVAVACDAPAPPSEAHPQLHAHAADLQQDEPVDVSDDAGMTRAQPTRTPPAPPTLNPEAWRASWHTLERIGCGLAERGVVTMLPESIECGARQSVLRACAGFASDPVAVSKALHRVPSWREAGVDRVTLPMLLEERGFSPPTGFRALVVEITLDPSRDFVVQERAFEVGDSERTADWNPASTVKLYGAIGALQRLNALGFSSRARLALDTPSHPRTSVRELLREAIVDSDNIAHNRLVQLADFETLNLGLLGPKFGLTNSFINRPYDRNAWVALGEGPSLRNAPKMILKQSGREHVLDPSQTPLKLPCRRAACTSLRDLADTLRRLMLQEQLPSCETFALANADLRYLRRILRAPRARGDRIVRQLRKAFDATDDIRFYHKPGYSDGWYSDAVYIYIPGHRQTWIVAMTAREGRRGLDAAARHVGELLASGSLHRQPQRLPPADDAMAEAHRIQ